MELAAYVRVSTDEQREGPSEQLATIKEWCSRHGHTVVAEYIDAGVSGGKPLSERPAAQQMLSDAKGKRFSGICCKQLDRLGRNAVDLIGFAAASRRAKLQILFTKEEYADDPQGRLIFGIMANIAEYFRSDIGRKIRDHNRHISAQGRYAGCGLVLGYRYNKETKQIEVDEERVADALAVFRAYVDANGNASEAARMLNATGMRPSRNGSWRADGVLSLLRSHLYRGFIQYQEIITPVDIPRIIPESLLAQVDMIMAWRRKPDKGRSNTVKYPYSGIMTCAICGGAYQVAARYQSKRYGALVVWKCIGRIGSDCPAHGISSRELDRMVGVALKGLLEPHKQAMKGRPIREAKPAPSNRKRLEGMRRRLVEVYLSGHIDKEDYEQRLAEIDGKLTEKPPEVKPQNLVAALGVALEDIEGMWKAATLQQKRAIMLQLQARIVYNAAVPSLQLVTAIGESYYGI